MTIAEIAKELNIKPKAAKTRLIRYGFKPISYAGPTGIYDPSALEAIRNAPGRGRPSKKSKNAP